MNNPFYHLVQVLPKGVWDGLNESLLVEITKLDEPKLKVKYCRSIREREKFDLRNNTPPALREVFHRVVGVSDLLYSKLEDEQRLEIIRILKKYSENKFITC